MVEARKHFKVVQNHKSRGRAVFQVWGQNVSVLLVLNSRQKRLPVTLSSGNPLLSQDTEKQKAYGGKKKGDQSKGTNERLRNDRPYNSYTLGEHITIHSLEKKLQARLSEK